MLSSIRRLVFLVSCGFPKVKILEKEQPDRVLISKNIARRPLLKQVHVAQMQLSVMIDLIDKTCEKSVLVEDVVHDFLPKIDHHLVVEQKLEAAGGKFFLRQRQEKCVVESDAPVEIVAVRQRVVVQNSSVEPLFEPQPLHQPRLFRSDKPLDLLPGAMFRLRNIFVVVARKMIDKTVARRQPHVVEKVKSQAGAEEELGRFFHKIFFQAKMDVRPRAPSF